MSRGLFGSASWGLVSLCEVVCVKRNGDDAPTELVAALARGLEVLEVAFDSAHRSTRHKSGVAMRFPRVARIRWDKPAAEADRLETLERMIV